VGRDKLGNTLSHPILVLSGIPQGSNLGSIVFFLFFVNDVGDIF